MSETVVMYHAVWSVIKGNEPLIHGAPPMSLRSIMLGEKKPDTEGNILCDSINVIFLR